MSRRPYRRFSKEFKLEAVRLAEESDQPVTQVARELGIRVNQIYKWRKELNAKQGDAFPGKGHVWFWKPEDAEPLFQSKKIPNGRCLSLHPDGRRWMLMVSNSPNGNGRTLKDGKYLGGTARLHLLEFPS